MLKMIEVFEFGASLLEGSIPSINNLFSFIIFALKTLISPNSVFINYDDNNNIWSYGENIRMICRLNNNPYKFCFFLINNRQIITKLRILMHYDLFIIAKFLYI